MPQNSKPVNPQRQKWLIGGCAALCLIVALVMQFTAPDQDAIQGSFVRIGLVLAALAWAFPKPGEQFGWQKLAPLIIAFAVLMVLTKKMILFLVPAVILVGIALKFTRPSQRPQVLRKLPQIGMPAPKKQLAGRPSVSLRRAGSG
ncbi:MAG: hypothetical protein U0903_07815 [Planctomycetales bacterium]